MTFEYFDKVRDILKTVELEEKDVMNRVSDLLSKTIEEKRSIFIFGASHAGILTQELFYRAGGLMTINPIFGESVIVNVSPITHTSKMERLEGYGTLLANKTKFKKEDVLILHSVSGRNPVTIELAIEAKKLGVKTICLTSIAYSKTVSSRHSSGKNLYEYCDFVIDNHGEIGDGTCSIPNVEQKVGPTSTVIGAAILNSIVVETVRKLKENGMKTPPIFYSANLDDGDALNQQLFEEYQDSIHYEY
ncbi:SIS domain-containing protein [Fundicoccus culcitae]|uniref:SIS domain-containing protein n=1 Tax=Fundicoccus culcitae TaxID=2969821 RepID=A0ABY5P471_9LACT|nr:SIS domain-containing protein [Fundicoccus culcitae]UUX33532.1 SIS domain-containing protein [Fundicoccus culcitae]